ncbi:hypothetical protein BO70DRAFT_366700 [Aspergillus heteromorphus CBS 117.55]|uniref:Uncharacterized protein n=1 Tax=Aspergillus heteromorphus CBS 117.55 TaxID=1448321 RepID=A0A317UYK2_9EURO|nr:uncharacterized protein BO70DRAFT_366700 [Aspergillus heteromorphus CBS 117.55]PWY65572.1 hypothetical protein BO70DRAFT_366700 [Aspergillus heteromorphus CBS 117.55]
MRPTTIEREGICGAISVVTVTLSGLKIVIKSRTIQYYSAARPSQKRTGQARQQRP